MSIRLIDLNHKTLSILSVCRHTYSTEPDENKSDNVTIQ